MSILTVFLLALSTAPLWAETPSWIKPWEDFARKPGNEEWIDWVKQLKTKEAIELGAAWADYLGYTAPEIIAKSKKAPDIKPGLVITAENYENYPGLKELMSPALYARLKKGAYAHIPYLKILPTVHGVPGGWGRLNLTKKMEGTCKLAPDGELLNWKGGIPFPHPDLNSPWAGWQIAHSCDRQGCAGNDQFAGTPMDFLFVDRKMRKES